MTYAIPRALAAVLLLAGCTTTGLGAPGGGTGSSVKAGVTEWSPTHRDMPIGLIGPLVGGGRLDLASLHGKVVVINVWGSWCGPCNEEAPALAAAYAKLDPQGVRFVGIDTREPSASAAAAFIKNHQQIWPSLSDDGGALLLPFRGKVNPSAVPATLVLDRQGRVAARVLGAVRTDTLTALVATVLAEASTCAWPRVGPGP